MSENPEHTPCFEELLELIKSAPPKSGVVVYVKVTGQGKQRRREIIKIERPTNE
jgi:hypothetical protein